MTYKTRGDLHKHSNGFIYSDLFSSNFLKARILEVGEDDLHQGTDANREEGLCLHFEAIAECFSGQLTTGMKKPESERQRASYLHNNVTGPHRAKRAILVVNLAGKTKVPTGGTQQRLEGRTRISIFLTHQRLMRLTQKLTDPPGKMETSDYLNAQRRSPLSFTSWHMSTNGKAIPGKNE